MNMKLLYVFGVLLCGARYSEGVCSSNCEFPFTYDGKEHTACTLDGDTRYWCFTPTSWDYCAADCPREGDIIPMCSTGCLFPFEYGGKSFTACTKYLDTDYWCVTKDGWDYCAEDCPKEETKISDCTTTSGDPCVFPFKYLGTSHDSCILDDSSYLWCATSVDGLGEYRSWGYCSDNCNDDTLTTTTPLVVTPKLPKNPKGK